MRHPIFLLALTAALGGQAGTSHAAESYDNCTGFVDVVPAVITTQGTWCLRQDVSTTITNGSAITIAVNNVTLDCNNFKVGGLSAGPSTFATGIRAENKLNAVVRNCNIRGFYYGAYLGGDGHLLENNRLESNTYVGLYAEGNQATIRGNLLFDTGGSTIQPGSAFGIAANGNGIHMLDNTVDGVVPNVATGTAYGIFLGASDAGTIAGNRVSGLFASDTGTKLGIWANGGRLVVHHNVVNGPPGSASETGVLCSTNTVTAYQNVTAGFDPGINGCLLSGNVVNVN